ncbi:SpvB/TcaC N-terminal domain-containing protein [Nitrosomonas sp. Nm166]|uniref:SpvB/TcaC N-terminal domain-containing protein n=1 Tax=Nitrosomonas sp. Nm166 TaxID=1881054 RepID=UPI0008E53C74|nr:SpvB/TcaC N-terminal domain-containing protein [Nitrosomonas sp. Nm166]SFE35143.1 RHS repeat-associated core domain-containing protein [Nitrosomonas sp. Nm166]
MEGKDSKSMNKDREAQKDDSFTLSAPKIELPKGGGAIRGMGEKFAANPVTGTGSMAVPIATSPGRSGFGPELSLSYDSASGNGSFGFGWSLSLPSITRKTDKGLPQYLDGHDHQQDSDTFILSGAEDLVPVFKKKADVALEEGELEPEEWEFDEDGNHKLDESSREGYSIRRYRPRIEGLFARIERWTNVNDPGDVHWRSISKDNILTLYGRNSNSRIADPADPRKIFSWLICETRDEKGNAILYEYHQENDAGVDLMQANERNRSRAANRYIKRIRYGNQSTLLIDGRRPVFLTPDQLSEAKWLFEVVFDYGEDHYRILSNAAQRPQIEAATEPADPSWPVRPDPFSSYRAGFEVRTYRRCQRVLMFHHFTELGVHPYLVRSTEFNYTDFEYADDALPNPLDELKHEGSTRFASFIQNVSQSGYLLDNSVPGESEVLDERIRKYTYFKKSLPPLQFKYSKAKIQETISELDAASLENLPIGLDGSHYQWVDLDGEGVTGILTEQANAWFYKPNLGGGKFGPLQPVARQPSLAALSGGNQQLLDLAGNGQLDLVAFSGPTPGFYERTHDEDWEPFQSFKTLPNIPWDEPNLKFIDLNGDGHADILISEHQVFTWHLSLAEDGFAPARQVTQPLDEEQGPRLVFADGTQSIYLADMCGDGLTDLVRIRNGEVCYWPNLGYGRFGAKITMDNAPWFDHSDQFSQQRIRLADIDGSGANDILYLHRDGVRLYFNQSGNRWSAPYHLHPFPQIDNLTSVMTADLLGNGTACLVWSSSLSGDSRRPLRYLDLMDSQKPHLLIEVNNNLGAITTIQYTASTKFYLADKAAGTPWITKLPFPVHVVEQVIVEEKWRETRFSSRYSYHHGYFDGHEREFRGFGRVEQVDTEHYGKFTAGNTASPYITDDHQLYQPPIKTITWFHTGAFLNRERILSQFQQEYFRSGRFTENVLPEPDLAVQNLSVEEWREALRACKGMMLRQEIFELDVDALTRGEEQRVKLFSTAYHNCHIQRLQPRADNRHAVFLVTGSEAITYHYELDLRDPAIAPDPRIAHTLNLRTDSYGNVLESVAVAYPRSGRHIETDTGTALLPADTPDRIREVQDKPHLVYSENRFTEDIDDPHDSDNPPDLDNHRLPLPYEVKTYELTGLEPEADELYYSLANLRQVPIADPTNELPYHQLTGPGGLKKRCVEHVRMLYFDRNLSDALPLGRHNTLALPYETYKLALTEDLLEAILSEKLNDLQTSDESRESMFNRVLHEAGYHHFADDPGRWWVRSGTAGFTLEGEQHAAQHFFLPERYTDPFGNQTTLEYDGNYDLYIRSSRDPMGNETAIEVFDYRVLAPSRMRDINDNRTEVAFDTLGLPAAVALKGKPDGNEGDNLDPVPPDLDTATLIRFFTGNYNEAEAHEFLGNATARHLYYFGETEERDADGNIAIRWGASPASACGILREKHVAQLDPDELPPPLQLAFEYSDGSGNVLVKKVQAESENEDGTPRWIANGKTILNNKGKPVKQYEPYFTVSQRFEEPAEVGVTPILYYDAAGRPIRTEAPDGSYSRVEFTPWFMAAWDASDTVLERDNAWYTRHINGTAAEQYAARMAELHANTPTVTHLDSLGREVIAIAHNRFPDNDVPAPDSDPLRRTWLEERYVTCTHLDAEGKPLWIRDARGNRVMEYIKHNPSGTGPEYFPAYDIAGNLLFQHSMDGGDRWMLMDSTGQPHYAWDRNERVVENDPLQEENRLYRTIYDKLRRPREQRLQIDGGTWLVTERLIYGESLAEAKTRNLRGQVYQHYDPSGLITNELFDFKGNLLEVTRQLASAYAASIIDWPEDLPDSALEQEIFTQRTQYDALNRMIWLENWHREDRSDRPPAVYIPRYNQRGILAGETLTVRGEAREAIRRIEYDAKGQRMLIECGNDTITRYYYDEKTFRLMQLRTAKRVADVPLPSPPGDHTNLNVLQNLYYTYDPSGNITEIHDNAYQPEFFQNQIVEPSSTYTYDALYRLIEASGRENGAAVGAPSHIVTRSPEVTFAVKDRNALRNYTQRYSYDPVGNIKAMQHIAGIGSWTRRYDYANDSNRLTRTHTNNPAEMVDYRYDIHGSMLNIANVDPGRFLRWDTRDMIHALDLIGGGWAYYQYDSNKQRTRKRIERNNGGNTVEERLYLGGMELYRRWQNGNLMEEIETHHLFVDDQRVLMVEDVLITDDSNLGTKTLDRYQYSNHLGSVALELDGEARIISYEEYHPYGTTAYQAYGSEVKAVAKRYRYTGMERDEESGLSYHTTRYYLPWVGRWGSCDPKGISDGINLWSYARNQPINLVDIFGTDATVAEHQVSRREIERTVHIGVLVVPGTALGGTQEERSEHLSRQELEIAAEQIEIELRATYHDFTVQEDGTTIHYTFAIDVQISTDSREVVSTDLDTIVNNPEATYRDASSARQEALAVGVENVAIIVPSLPGPAHAPTIGDHSHDESTRDARRLPGLMAHTANAMLIGYRDDISTRSLTAAHEAGHILGLTNASDPTSIMGPRSSSRSLTSEDERLIHRAIHQRLPGFSFPEVQRTSGRETPFRPRESRLSDLQTRLERLERRIRELKEDIAHLGQPA